MTDIARPVGVHQALAAVAADLGGIDKSERNTEQNFNFRSIDAIAGAIRPLFGKHGLSVTPYVEDVTYTEVESKRGTKGYRCVAWVRYQIRHEDGSAVEARMVGEAVDYGDKSTSKAVQMAYKYMLTELCIVGAGDRDPDGHTVEEMGRGEPLSELEIAERATNKLKGDILEIVGDRKRAVKAYRDAVSSLGLDPDEPVPGEEHERVLAIVQALEEPAVDATDVAGLPLDDADNAPFEEPQ